MIFNKTEIINLNLSEQEFKLELIKKKELLYKQDSYIYVENDHCIIYGQEGIVSRGAFSFANLYYLNTDQSGNSKIKVVYKLNIVVRILLNLTFTIHIGSLVLYFLNFFESTILDESFPIIIFMLIATFFIFYFSFLSQISELSKFIRGIK